MRRQKPITLIGAAVIFAAVLLAAPGAAHAQDPAEQSAPDRLPGRADGGGLREAARGAAAGSA